MSDPRKPIDNGRSWKAEFLPGSPGEKAIESLGLRPDHLRHDLVAFDEQIESLTAEITRLRARVAELEAQRDRWKAIAEKRHAILLDLEWVVDAKDGDGSYCPYCMSMDDEVHVAGCKMAEAIAESARAANGRGEG